tara:strand:+ start:737 stop:1504 length:768 start_codon:yes stop_codon:yes gene_type:complete
MIDKLTLSQAWNYHIIISWVMFFFILFFSFLGYYFNKYYQETKLIKNTSIFIFLFCIAQEIIDHINRFFLDVHYTMSWQKDLPIHFCHIAFYFSLIVIYIQIKKGNINKCHTLFCISYLLGLSGALQGILTPDFTNINNFIAVLSGHLQHSLIILNVFWLLFAYKMKLNFKGVFYTYLFINFIAPIAIFINYLLGFNSKGDYANYLYVMELPQVNNFLVNMISQYPFPKFILYAQPLILFYLIILYIPFYFKYKR